MPIRIQQVWSDGCGKLSEPLRRESHVPQLIDVPGIRFYLGIKLSYAALGSCHPRCELILFNQALGETIDQPLKCMLVFETQGF